jgi:ribosomal small subunit protein bTHX
MGKHDRKSRKGKVYRGTYGKRRLRKSKKRVGAASR